MPTLKERSLENTKEASKFANLYIDKIKLSYIPKKSRNNMLNDVSGYITVDILCEDIVLDKIDIMNRIDEMLGQDVLRYMEYKSDNNLNDVRHKLLKGDENDSG